MQDPEFSSVEARQALMSQVIDIRPGEEEKAALTKGLFIWFADYLIDNGYWVDDLPILYNDLQAFPSLLPENENEVTVDNMEQASVSYRSTSQPVLG